MKEAENSLIKMFGFLYWYVMNPDIRVAGKFKEEEQLGKRPGHNMHMGAAVDPANKTWETREKAP